MATNPLTRNLRDGQLVISDGAGSPTSLTLTLDNGDLEWTEPEEEVEIKDRGVLDHVRPGDEQSCELSYSAMWVHLIGDTITGSSDGVQLYELLNNIHDTYTSVRTVGEKFCTKHEFTVNSPDNVSGRGEKVTFAAVWKKSLRMGEGDPNSVQFNGGNWETRPTIARV